MASGDPVSAVDVDVMADEFAQGACLDAVRLSLFFVVAGLH